jgi:hypothetical protein
MKWPPENQNPRTDGNQARTSKNGIDLRLAEHALSIKKPGRQQERSSPVEVAAPLTAAGLYVCRHFRIDPDLADLVAALAGLGSNRRAA